MKRQHIGLAVRLLTSIGLLVLLLAFIDREVLLKTVVSADPAFYALGFLAFVCTMLTWTLRWHLFIRAVGESISFVKAFITLVISMFFAMFLPTIVGNDVGRVYELGRDDAYRKTNLVSTVLLDRLLGLITISLLAFMALITGSRFATNQGIVLIVIGTLALLISGWWIVFNQRFEALVFRFLGKTPILNRFSDSLREIYDALDRMRRQPRLMAVASGVSFVNSLCTILATLLAARSLGIETEVIYFFIFMPIIWIISIIPISLSGLGIREGAFVFFFAQVGVTPADAVAISLLYYSYNIIFGILGGILMISSSRVQPRHQKAEA